jgi:tetratricopeptide (TPR) repeat protein
MRKPYMALALGALLALAPFAVVAQGQEPTPYPECTKQVNDADREAAKAAFNVGTASYNEADYSRAIQYWEDAYRRDCTAHALLLNLARAFESNGQKKHAVLALETYLQRSGDQAQKEQIQRRIEVLRKKIADEAAVAAATVPTATATAPVPAATSAATSNPPPDEGGSKPILPLIVAGVGGVAAIVGTVVYLGGKSDVDEAENLCPNRRCPPGREDLVDQGESGRSKQTTGAVIGVGGVVVGIAGVVWYVAAPAQGGAEEGGLRIPSTRARVAPAVAPGFAGLAVSGAF